MVTQYHAGSRAMWAKVEGFQNEIIISEHIFSDYDYVVFILDTWLTEDERRKTMDGLQDTYPYFEFLRAAVKSSDIVSMGDEVILDIRLHHGRTVDFDPLWARERIITPVPMQIESDQYVVFINGIVVLPSHRISTFHLPMQAEFAWVNLYKHQFGDPLLSHDILRVSSPYHEMVYFIRKDWFTPVEHHRYAITKDIEEIKVNPWFVKVTQCLNDYQWPNILTEFDVDLEWLKS